jgi:hypothetical protein
MWTEHRGPGAPCSLSGGGMSIADRVCLAERTSAGSGGMCALALQGPLRRQPCVASYPCAPKCGPLSVQGRAHIRGECDGFVGEAPWRADCKKGERFGVVIHYRVGEPHRKGWLAWCDDWVVFEQRMCVLCVHREKLECLACARLERRAVHVVFGSGGRSLCTRGASTEGVLGILENRVHMCLGEGRAAPIVCLVGRTSAGSRGMCALGLAPQGLPTCREDCHVLPRIRAPPKCGPMSV